MAVIKHQEQRVGIFIDTQNLYHSAKNIYKARVNFANVLKDALADRLLIRAIAYVVATEGGEEKVFLKLSSDSVSRPRPKICKSLLVVPKRETGT